MTDISAKHSPQVGDTTTKASNNAASQLENLSEKAQIESLKATNNFLWTNIQKLKESESTLRAQGALYTNVLQSFSEQLKVFSSLENSLHGPTPNAIPNNANGNKSQIPQHVPGLKSDPLTHTHSFTRQSSIAATAGINTNALQTPALVTRQVSNIELDVHTIPNSPQAVRTQTPSVAAEMVPHLDLILTFPLFRDLPKEASKRIALTSYEMRRKAGQTLISEGEAAAEFFFILEGKVSILAANQAEISSLQAPAFFGELGMCKCTSIMTVAVSKVILWQGHETTPIEIIPCKSA
jgi:hypothetical protein